MSNSLEKWFHRAFLEQFRAVSEQFQCSFSFRAVLEKFQSSFRAVLEKFQSSFGAVSVQFPFQSSFRAVLEKFHFQVVSEQFQSSFLMKKIIKIEFSRTIIDHSSYLIENMHSIENNEFKTRIKIENLNARHLLE